MNQQLISRIAQVVVWLGLGVAVIGTLIARQGPDPLILGISAVVAALSVVLAIRSYRMSVRYGPDGIQVRGFLLSRWIPRDEIIRITGFPAVRWQSASGKARWTPIFAFFGVGQLASVERYNQFCILRLKTWDEERHRKPGPDPSNPRRPRGRDQPGRRE